MLKRIALFALGVSAFAASECNFAFTLNAANPSVIYNNQTHGCYYWAVSYYTSGYSAVSIDFQFAPNGATSTVPGAFTSFGGVWPSSTLGQAIDGAGGLFPWVKVSLLSSAGTGLVTGQILGEQITANAITGLFPAGTPSTYSFPVLIAGEYQGDGTIRTIATDSQGQVQVFRPCSATAPIVFSASSGTLQIVGAVSGEAIYVCHLSLSSDTATDITLVHGTGTNCNAGTASFSGAYKVVNTMALDFGWFAAIETGSGEEFCVTSSVTANVGGMVVYGQF